MAQNCQIPLQVLDVEAVTNPMIGVLTDYWCARAAGKPPDRSAFDFMKIYKTAPNLLMAERVANEIGDRAQDWAPLPIRSARKAVNQVQGSQ